MGASRTVSVLQILVQVVIFFSVFLSMARAELYSIAPSDNNCYDKVNVGVVLDLGSWLGKTIHSCITMAVSDFYSTNQDYRTRIALHVRNTEGRRTPFQALSSAYDLLGNMNVEAIIGPETSAEERYLAYLGGDMAKVPRFSFSPSVASSSSSDKNPYIVRIGQDPAAQFEGIAALAESLKWRVINLIYEDSDYGNEISPNIVQSFHSRNIHIAYKIPISPSSSDDEIVRELHKLLRAQTTVSVVHLSPNVASRFFLIASSLEMMKQGRYQTWIITDNTMNFLHSLKPGTRKLLQGCIGFKPHIPTSRKLTDAAIRWRKLYNSTLKMDELSAHGIWAYDLVYAIAQAVERISTETFNSRNLFPGLSSLELENFLAAQRGRMLLDEMSQIRLQGLSGDFQIRDNRLRSKAFSIVKLTDENAMEVGFWDPVNGIRGTDRFESLFFPGELKSTRKERRRLSGGEKNTINLRIGIPSGKRFDELISVHHDPQTNATNVSGFCFDVFRTAVQSVKNYDVTFEFITLTNGSYNEYVTRVYHKELDVLIGDFTITANRTLYVDFTAPYTDIGVGTVARLNDKDMWIFLKPLDEKLWIATAVFILIKSLAVWAIEKYYNNPAFKGSLPSQIGTALFFGFSTLVFSHREKLKSNLSKILVTVWLLLVLVLISTYTATLSSLLTVQQIQLKNTAEEYIGIPSGGLVKGLVVNNMNFKGNQLRPYYTLEELADALDRGIKHGGVAAIIDEIPYIKLLLAKYPGKYAMIESAPTTNGFAFVMQKGSPLVPELSRAIMKLREEGKLALIEKAWFNSQSTLLPDDRFREPKVLSFDRFGGLFLISGICTVSALLLIGIRVLLDRLSPDHFLMRLLKGGNLELILMYLVPTKNQVEPSAD